jgi:hypothetical protein
MATAPVLRAIAAAANIEAASSDYGTISVDTLAVCFSLQAAEACHRITTINLATNKSVRSRGTAPSALMAPGVS